MARWSENSDFLRLVDTDYARPKPARAFEDKTDANAEGQNAIEFRIRTIAEDRLVGFIAIHGIEWNNQAGELSIGIGDPADWDRGYGSEAMQMMLRYAFNELNLYRVGLNTISYNERAIRVYERAGFVREGVQRSFGQRDGRRYDLILMSILQDEWRGRA
jgi:RimJ/RimL family protein N-acetyltransferase